MAYDGNIPAPQGAIKLSEIATDRDQPGISIVAGDSALVFVERTRKLVGDAARRNNFLLVSEGRMSWSGTDVRFDTDLKANNARLSILQTEPINASTINVIADTHSTDVIDNILGATQLFVGMLVTGPGIPNGSFIKTVLSPTSAQLTQAATATAAGVSLVLNISQAARTIQLYMCGAVTSNATTANGNTDLTGITGVSAFSIGQYVFGAGIQAGSFIVQILSGTSVRLNKPCTAAATVPVDFVNAPSFTFTADSHTTNVLDNIPNVAGLKVGMYVTGSGIPANTTIAAILSSTSIQLSAATSTSVAGVTVTGYAVMTATNYFKSIPLANNEMIYFELDRDYILNNSLPTGFHVLENAINGGSLAAGYTVKRVTVSPTSGMPPLTIPLAGPTNSFFYPIAARFDGSDGVSTFQDIWWIPHGIRWPQGSSSFLGAVIVSGFSAWPDYFVNTQLQLQQAITSASANNGGIICVTSGFSLDTPITVPDNVLIVGKGFHVQLNMLPGSSFTLGNMSEIRGLRLINTLAFTSGSLVTMASGKTRSCVRDCQFNLVNTTGSVAAVTMAGDQGRSWNTQYLNVAGGGTTRIGLDFLATATGSADVDSIFT